MFLKVLLLFCQIDKFSISSKPTITFWTHAHFDKINHRGIYSRIKMTRSSRKKNRVKLLTWFKNSQEKSFYFEKVSKHFCHLRKSRLGIRIDSKMHNLQRAYLIFVIFFTQLHFKAWKLFTLEGERA